MANLTGTNNDGIDIWDPNQWDFDSLISASETIYEYETPDGNTVQIIGSGFTYDEQGNPIGGTVQAMQIHEPGGDQIASLVLGDAPFADLAADDFDNFWEVLLANDDVVVTGHLADIVSGNAGDDLIWGGGGDDTIFGGADNDTLNGENGDDKVYGGAGDDTIIFNVEQGDDRIFGGSGQDTVVHNGLTSDWGDIITDLAGCRRGRWLVQRRRRYQEPRRSRLPSAADRRLQDYYRRTRWRHAPSWRTDQARGEGGDDSALFQMMQAEPNEAYLGLRTMARTTVVRSLKSWSTMRPCSGGLQDHDRDGRRLGLQRFARSRFQHRHRSARRTRSERGDDQPGREPSRSTPVRPASD